MPSNAETPKVPRIEDLIESNRSVMFAPRVPSSTFLGHTQADSFRNRHYAASVHKPLPPLMTMVKNDFKTWGPHILVGIHISLLAIRPRRNIAVTDIFFLRLLSRLPRLPFQPVHSAGAQAVRMYCDP